METGIQPEISIVPEEKAPVLLSRYPYVRVSNIRTCRDYLYYKEDLQLFAGRRYSGQRNHIKKDICLRISARLMLLRPVTGFMQG